ncbi:ribosome silencing factor [Pelagibius marinus]|uniref:ribosome silencing factor n=1 Tax=Pelagibius marinus TaxID=2762760 RepID=UPI002AC32328|nr:ribosome silencing factor [Pelagibius marinus]
MATTKRRFRVILQKTKAPRADLQDALAHSRRLLSVVESSLEDDKADDIVVIELADKSSIADFMVIASGRSARQVGAMADHLREKLKAEGVHGVAAEGQARCDWVLIDGGDVIVHLFRPEVRSFYNLEKMWGANLAPAGGEAELDATVN